MKSRIGFYTVATFLLALAATAKADDNDAPGGGLTFTKDIAPILQENCQSCHRPEGAHMSGMIAPMALMTYEEVRPWVKSIAKKVQDRQMPPWHADTQHHGTFKNERTLTDKEITTIAAWVNAGAPKGKPEDAPAPRVLGGVDGWAIGKPDLIVKFEQPFTVQDDVVDLYQNITAQLTDEMLPEDRFIQAVEIKPGSSVVHHILTYAYPPETASADVGRGDRGLFGIMALGTDPGRYPDGYGFLLRKGSRVNFQMHYHKVAGPGTAKDDVSSVGMIFAKGPVKHAVKIDAISNGRFEIPPMVNDWKIGMSRLLDKDITVLNLFPHTHLRGKAAKYVAYYPDGKVETLLDVPRYDFNWQSFYEFKEPKRLPAGTRIDATQWYDNSPGRQQVASEVDPSKSIRFGGPTTDEMDLAWVTYTVDSDDPFVATPAAGETGEGVH